MFPQFINPRMIVFLVNYYHHSDLDFLSITATHYFYVFPKITAKMLGDVHWIKELVAGFMKIENLQWDISLNGIMVRYCIWWNA